MTEPDRDALLAEITAPQEVKDSLRHLGDMIERDPWTAHPEPPPKPEPLYSVQPWKDTRFFAVMKEVTGSGYGAGRKKDLVVVAAYKKGAQEVARLLNGFEALRRENVNLKHQVRRAKCDA
jgi:hypothetical protein